MSAMFSGVSRVTIRKAVVVSFACVGMALGVAIRANAAPVVLTFEGLGDRANINGFYNGGTDSQGNSGPNYGIEFIGIDQALVIDPLTSGMTGEPTPPTVWMINSGWGGDTMNMVAGFDGFSFHYETSSASPIASVTLYDGLNGTGNVLATGLSPFFVGDPWAFVDVAFSGIAHSAVFDAGQSQFFLDDLTLNSAAPDDGVSVAEPGTLGMMLCGLAFIAVLCRRRRLS